MEALDYYALLMRSSLSPDRQTRAALSAAITDLDFPLDVKIAKFLELATGYSETTSSPLSAEAAGDYKAIVESLIPLADSSIPFFAIAELRRLYHEQHFSFDLLKAMEILKVGDSKDPTKRGTSAAIEYLYDHMPRIETDTEPEIDLLADYDAMKAGKVRYPQSGYQVIDESTGGHVPGELWIVEAYTGQGKSTLLRNMAYSRRMAGWSGIYWTTEMTAQQVMRLFTIRHSLHPKFGGVGILDSEVKRGVLSSQNEKLWRHVVNDWMTGPYPPLHVRVASTGSTVGMLMTKSEDIHRQQGPISVIYLDYLSQLRTGKYQTERESQTHLYLEAKAYALNFDGRRGVCLITAAQMNAESYKCAVETGRLTIRSVAETAEAERSADFLMALLRTPEDETAHVLKAFILKCRDGQSGQIFMLREDFQHSAIFDLTQVEPDNTAWRISV